MFKTFIILKVYTSTFSFFQRAHIQYRDIYIIKTLHSKRNVPRFLQHGTYHVVVRGGSHFCQSPKGGGQEFFLLKRKGGPTLFWEKNTKIPQPSPPPPPQEKTYLPLLYFYSLSNTVKDILLTVGCVRVLKLS